MRKRTTTQKLHEAITNGLFQIIKAEIHHKTTRKTDVIGADIFKESMDFICETIFAGSIGWYFERNYKTGNYEIDCSRMDGSVETIVTVYLTVCNGASRENVEKELNVIEEE